MSTTVEVPSTRLERLDRAAWWFLLTVVLGLLQVWTTGLILLVLGKLDQPTVLKMLANAVLLFFSTALLGSTIYDLVRKGTFFEKRRWTLLTMYLLLITFGATIIIYLVQFMTPD